LRSAVERYPAEAVVVVGVGPDSTLVVGDVGVTVVGVMVCGGNGPDPSGSTTIGVSVGSVGDVGLVVVVSVGLVVVVVMTSGSLG
jgi:L-ascorbate metabolism protein UlaG (beta-lactamase superfamily)